MKKIKLLILFLTLNSTCIFSQDIKDSILHINKDVLINMNVHTIIDSIKYEGIIYSLYYIENGKVKSSTFFYDKEMAMIDNDKAVYIYDNSLLSYVYGNHLMLHRNDYSVSSNYQYDNTKNTIIKYYVWEMVDTTYNQDTLICQLYPNKKKMYGFAEPNTDVFLRNYYMYDSLWTWIGFFEIPYKSNPQKNEQIQYLESKGYQEFRKKYLNGNSTIKITYFQPYMFTDISQSSQTVYINKTPLIDFVKKYFGEEYKYVIITLNIDRVLLYKIKS